MTEGTYPCHPGGVSVWCDKLIRGLPESKFHLFAITGSPSFQPMFQIPENVATSRLLPLWGTEEPGAEEPLFSETYRRKLRTDSRVIRDKFLDPFETCVRALIAPGTASRELACAMLQLYKYFREYDYARSVTSPEAWSAFLNVCSDRLDTRRNLNLDEATSCMRWLQRYLAVLSVEYPRVDITHASMSGFAGIPGVILKLLHGSRFLLSEHGLYLRELHISLSQLSYSSACRSFLLALNESVIRMNYEFADAVTSLCEFNRKWQIRLGADSRKIRIVPNGVDEDVFSPQQQECSQHRAYPNGAGPDPVVLTMSRIMPLKGIDVLLRAAIKVRQRVPRVKFRIMGEPATGEYYRDCMTFIAEHGLQETIEVGHTNDPASAYRTPDLFCLPSISEAMPYSVIEAMFSGCPVVATDVGGVSELLGGTGCIVRPNDPVALASAISDLFAGAEGLAARRKMAEAALARARKNYTLGQTTDRFRNLYRELGAAIPKSYDNHETSASGSQRYSLANAG